MQTQTEGWEGAERGEYVPVLPPAGYVERGMGGERAQCPALPRRTLQGSDVPCGSSWNRCTRRGQGGCGPSGPGEAARGGCGVVAAPFLWHLG